jgi:glycosyltransferase involved in cell wall biosynthesis
VTAPVRILFTIPNFTTAGSGHAMLQVVRGLDPARYAPSIAVLKRGGRLEAEVERLGIPYFVGDFMVDPRPLWSLPARARRAAQAFRGRGFDLWHSFHYLDDYTEPLVARFAGARAFIYTKKNMSWNRRSWLLRTLLARRIGAQNTDMLRQFFSSPLVKGRARLVPPSVDTDRFSPGTSRRLRLRQELGVPDGAPVISCVAHILPVKNQLALVQAMSRVDGARLWLAGREVDLDYSARVRRLIEELGLGDRVMLLGEVQDVPALLAETDVFVLPTSRAGRMEGCPVALLEAMASGVACVASDIPGSHDVIEDHVNGILFDPESADRLAEALAELASDAPLRRRLGEAGVRTIESRFRVRNEVTSYESLYAEALGAN